ncbi:MAG: hypothetical protein M3O92_00325 [Actinomycetota bacterium]|nr:hypothetical protein [Actinomycetota bacterium]
MATAPGTASQFIGDEGQQALSLPRQDEDVLQTVGGYDSLGVDVGDDSLDGPGTAIDWNIDPGYAGSL